MLFGWELRHSSCFEGIGLVCCAPSDDACENPVFISFDCVLYSMYLSLSLTYPRAQTQ